MRQIIIYGSILFDVMMVKFVENNRENPSPTGGSKKNILAIMTTSYATTNYPIPIRMTKVII